MAHAAALNLGRGGADTGARARSVDETPAAAPAPGVIAAAPRAGRAARRCPPLPGEAAFRARLDEEFARAERHGRPLSVIVLGCGPDGAIGDDVADLLRGVLRPGSLLARLDVHELALVLPEADGMDAYVAAERLVAHGPRRPHRAGPVGRRLRPRAGPRPR